jgi:hypothetical protein
LRDENAKYYKLECCNVATSCNVATCCIVAKDEKVQRNATPPLGVLQCCTSSGVCCCELVKFYGFYVSEKTGGTRCKLLQVGIKDAALLLRSCVALLLKAKAQRRRKVRRCSPLEGEQRAAASGYTPQNHKAKAQLLFTLILTRWGVHDAHRI